MLRYAQAVVEGRTIRYATEGSGSSLLLLHGLPFDHRLWAPVIPYLARRFRIVAPDLPGFGGSAAGVEESPEQLIRTIAGFATTMGLVPCAVAGAGLGGGVALGLAARYPERVTAVIGVGALGVEWWPVTAQARLARTARWLPGALPLAMYLFPAALARWYLRSALSDERLITPDVVRQLVETMRSAGSRRALARALIRLDDWHWLRRQLGAVRAPALLVWGERDRVYELPAAERLRLALPGASLVTLAGAGHLLPIERPVELAETIRHFLLRN
jgi:pimeloyl-ACP methyl ester carboxylesterase